MTNAYEVLGVEFTASAEDLKKAYRQLVREWHPDTRPPQERELATDKMEAINAAYATLSDDEKRREVDRRLEVYRCFEHPSRPGVAHCQVCETGLCQECGRLDEATGRIYCSGHAPDQAVFTGTLVSEERRATVAKPPCWLHDSVRSVTNCQLCNKPLCTKCVVFIGSKHYCEACAAAWRNAQAAEAHEAKSTRQSTATDREKEAIAARNRLRRNVGGGGA